MKAICPSEISSRNLIFILLLFNAGCGITPTTTGSLYPIVDVAASLPIPGTRPYANEARRTVQAINRAEAKAQRQALKEQRQQQKLIEQEQNRQEKIAREEKRRQQQAIAAEEQRQADEVQLSAASLKPDAVNKKSRSHEPEPTVNENTFKEGERVLNDASGASSEALRAADELKNKDATTAGQLINASKHLRQTIEKLITALVSHDLMRIKKVSDICFDETNALKKITPPANEQPADFDPTSAYWQKQGEYFRYTADTWAKYQRELAKSK